MKLALRIEVATLRGTREAVPRLAGILKEARASATFLFSLGPDHTGRALGSLPRVPRLKCYGLAALLSGTLLPGADIGRRGANAMRSVAAEGHEAGILAHDRVGWLKRIAAAGEAWTAAAMRRACERYEEIFGTPALTHGAPGWRMNRYAFRYMQRLGFRHGSDTRGTGPFIPVVRGELVACPQLPTTLPTLDELLAGGYSPDEAVQRLLEASREPPPTGHVYAARAEVEGTVFAPALRALIVGWQALGYQVVALRDFAAGLDLARLPRRSVALPAPGAAENTVAAEGEEFLLDAARRDS
ncbi:MAG TPA: 4-deoxy-4-formamido-L-arabinose-phosphoundecaprenol deformylase [Burkholderiales bacterium]|nr:4-deoxy-4-formamido-L-arabinose-phosphoundecaprenol deformylase [Burkholderiales bacterium]